MWIYFNIAREIGYDCSFFQRVLIFFLIIWRTTMLVCFMKNIRRRDIFALVFHVTKTEDRVDFIYILMSVYSWVPLEMKYNDQLQQWHIFILPFSNMFRREGNMVEMTLASRIIYCKSFHICTKNRNLMRS